jgi:dihydroorotate dehydrogenase (NAD+) catalytic subunit
MKLAVRLGPMVLSSPLVAAAGTVGSVVDFRDTIDFSLYGAAVAKSVSPTPWEGRIAPRIGPTAAGMLNGIGIQNPGVDRWIADIGPRLAQIPTPVWGSAVGHDPQEFAHVAHVMSDVDISAIEVNLSCPNLDGSPFALDPQMSHDVVASVREATDLPIGAKLSPDAEPIAAVADAVGRAGADWLVVANTVMGAGINPATRRPTLSGVIGGYSGLAVRPIAIRKIIEVARDVPDMPIVGCGGVSSGDHVVEMMLAGATAVGIGTAHFATPRIAAKITKQLERYGKKRDVRDISELIGAYEPW